MKKFETIEVNTAEQLDELYNDSSLTLEGLSEKSYGDFVDWCDKLVKLKKRRIYVVSGKTLNEYCGNTGVNAYPDDLHIVCIRLDDMANFNAVVLPRFEIGGRWFDDVVDNNRRRG